MLDGGQGGGAGTSTTGNAGGGNGGAGGGTGGTQRREPRGERRGPRVTRRSSSDYEAPVEVVDRLIARYGSRDRALEALAKDNFDLREDKRELGEELDQVKTKVVPDGAVVLTGPKAEAWKKIDALATELKLPEDKIGDTVVERVKKAGTLEGEKQKDALSAKRKEVAKAAGVNGDVLDPLLEQFGLEVETREVEVQDATGKSLGKKPVAHVRKTADANAPWEKLSDVIARDGSPLKPFAAALATKPAGQAGTAGSGGNAGTPGTPGITFPEQQGGDSGTGGASLVDDFLKKDRERANRPNPLRPPAQTTKGDGAAA
jgi:hypothetical protein